MAGLARAALVLLCVGCGARTGLVVPTIAERCDGEDDDGDGRIDEGVPPVICGVGACTRAVDGCVEGRPASCVPLPPADETCNARDDDCDGRTDESLGFGVVAGPFDVAREPTGYFTSDLVASGGGLVAVWNVGFDGSHPPTTNAFSRRLDADGHAVSDATPILGRPVTIGLTAVATSAGILLTYCGRFGFEDLAASAFLDPLGAPLGGEMRRGDGVRSCGAVSQSGIEAGAHLFFAWITNGGTPDGTYPVFLDVADEAGRTLDGRVAEVHGDLYTQPTLALRDERVALAYGLRTDVREVAIDVQLLDTSGAAIGAPVRAGVAAVEEHAYGGGHVAPTAEGFLVVAASSSGPGLFRARIGADGTLLAPLEQVDGSGRFEQLDLVSSTTGPAYVVANRYAGTESTLWVARLDADGRPEARWEGALPYGLVPALALEGERLFLTSADVDGTTLQIRELGCAP